LIDPLTALAFSIYENKGVYCLMLGSGVSRPAEIPTGWEITLDLVRRIAALRGVTDEPNWAAWYKATFGTDPLYSGLLDQLASTPDERRSVLHSYIEPNADDIAAGRKTPTRAHQAIARMVAAGHVRVIITTNFDRLIENALRENGVEPTVITSDDALKGACASSKSRRWTRSSSMGRTRSGKMLDSGSARPAPIAPVATRKMDAGPIGVDNKDFHARDVSLTLYR
jgi:hypothetical protein